MTSVQTDQALRLAKRIWGRFVLFDTKGVLALVHPESSWSFPGDPAFLPWAGRYRGSELKRFFDICQDTLDYLEYTVHAYHALGDKVVVLSRERCRVKRTGKLFTHELCALMTVREDKVSSFLEYADTAAMQAAFVE